MAATHSVAGHLHLDTADYDRRIRELVPAYAEMRAVHLDLLHALLVRPAAHVLDLGGGTGALAAAVAEKFPAATLEIWDTDPAMLEVARARCAAFGERVRYVARSFDNELPACDAVVACIALHHVKDLAVKARIYRHIFHALRPGGVFLNADTAVCATPALRAWTLGKWAESMGPHGIGAAEAHAYFSTWAHEDYYPPLATELRLLAEAGFTEPECFWREAAAVVFGAKK